MPNETMDNRYIPRTPGANAYWTVYNYDALGRTTSVVQPNNSGTTTYAYTGNKVTVTDPAGAWKSFLTDAMGNLTQVSEPNPAGGNFDTFYTYTVLNQLTTVSMTRPAVPGPGGTITQTRTFNYNGGVLLQSATNPENGTVSYTYNADGTVATKTDAKGTTLTYVYDSMARLIQVKNGAVVLRSLTYDDNSGYGQNLNGRLARVDYGAGNSQYGNNGIGWSELYSYHSAGAVLKKNLVMTRSGYKPANLEASWTYDDEGQVTAIKYPDYTAGGYPATGPTYTYSFDQMSRPLGLSDGGAPNNIASGATYGPAGQLTALNYGGIGESRSYNILNQLTAINSAAGTITYSYSKTNNDGRITGMSSTISGETVTYAYDSLKRLITASAGSQWGLSFSYDGFGNRLSQNVTAGTAPTIQQSYDMQTNRLLGQGYDNNGNMTSMGTFDAENRLVNAGTDTYDYAIDNKRIYKAVTGTINTEEVYFYAGGRRIATYQTSYSSPDANGNIPVSFVQPVYNVYFGGKLIISGGQPVVTDRLGSVVARLQNAYNLTFEKHSYFPYGEERTTSANNRDKFGTYFRDDVTGLDYADQRFYSSGMGRFVIPDPSSDQWDVSDPSGWNMYSSTESDPINFLDPDGLAKCADTIFVDHGVSKGTFGQLLDGKSDFSLISETVFTESAMSTSENGAKEMSVIAAVIMNRWQILNGYFWMYDSKDNLIRPSPDMGPAKATFAQLLQAPKQFVVWNGNELTEGAQGRLDNALGKDANDPQCLALFQAMGFAASYLSQKDKHQVYEIGGLVAISFNSNAPSKAPVSWQQPIGSFGSGNVFYGIPAEQVHSVPYVPVPLSPRKTRPKGTGRHSAP